MNVSQTQHATPMQHVTIQKDLINARVILGTVVMEFLAMVCTAVN
jgi:hypothetical protein